MITLVLLAGFALLQQPTPPFDLDALTVRGSALPDDCELSSSPSTPATAGRTTVGLWAGLPITSNPWKGTDPLVIATILDRMGGSSELPDGPPPATHALARYRRYQVGEVAEAYVAVYRSPSRQDLFTVYAVRFKDAARAAALDAEAAPGFHVASGDTLVGADGGGGPCGAALAAHLKQVTGRR